VLVAIIVAPFVVNLCDQELQPACREPVGAAGRSASPHGRICGRDRHCRKRSRAIRR
jgi:hypothetical protein